MMSLPFWLPGPMFLGGVSISGPMFLPGGLCLWSHVPTGGTTPYRDLPYGKERMVYILLECILVCDLFVDLHFQFPSFVALELDKEEIINVADF